MKQRDQQNKAESLEIVPRKCENFQNPSKSTAGQGEMVAQSTHGKVTDNDVKTIQLDSEFPPTRKERDYMKKQNLRIIRKNCR